MFLSLQDICMLCLGHELKRDVQDVHSKFSLHQIFSGYTASCTLMLTCVTLTDLTNLSLVKI